MWVWIANSTVHLESPIKPRTFFLNDRNAPTPSSGVINSKEKRRERKSVPSISLFGREKNFREFQKFQFYYSSYSPFWTKFISSWGFYHFRFPNQCLDSSAKTYPVESFGCGENRWRKQRWFRFKLLKFSPPFSSQQDLEDNSWYKHFPPPKKEV